MQHVIMVWEALVFFFQMQVETNTKSIKANSGFEHADAQTAYIQLSKNKYYKLCGLLLLLLI